MLRIGNWVVEISIMVVGTYLASGLGATFLDRWCGWGCGGFGSCESMTMQWRKQWLKKDYEWMCIYKDESNIKLWMVWWWMMTKEEKCEPKNQFPRKKKEMSVSEF